MKLFCTKILSMSFFLCNFATSKINKNEENISTITQKES